MRPPQTKRATAERGKRGASWGLTRTGYPVSIRTNEDGISLHYRDGPTSSMPASSISTPHGRVLAPRVPLTFHGSPASAAKPAPDLGGDTEAVLTEVLGRTSAEVSALRERGVISP